MDDELENLIGTEDGDHDNECANCHRLYSVSDGELRTKYCPECTVKAILEEEL